MSEAQPTAPEVDFLEEAPVAPAAEAAPAPAPEAEPDPLLAAAADAQESALTDPAGEAVQAAERELTLQEAACAARDRAEYLREQLVEVRRIQDAINAELKDLEQLCLRAETPPSLHEQNRYAQKLDEPEYNERSAQAGLLAQLAQRLAHKPHPPVFQVKLAK